MIIKFKDHRFNFDMDYFKAIIALFLAWLFSFRRGKKGKQSSTVIMFGQSLSGNLEAFLSYVMKTPGVPYDVYYLAKNKKEYNELRKSYGERILLSTKLAAMRKVMATAVMMSSHGPSIYYLLKWLNPKIKFVDVWHGIPFKKFPRKYWDMYEFYSGLFISSEWIKEERYIKRYGLSGDKLFVTGYSRLDKFHNFENTVSRVRKELQLDDRKIILYAPTYRLAGEAGEIPFGMSCQDFFGQLNDLCGRIGATLIFRPHMNSQIQSFEMDLPRIRFIPQRKFPKASDLLTAVDLLITDWSSIAVDFYALTKPVTFTKTVKPSHFSSGPALVEKAGDQVSNIEELIDSIKNNLNANKNDIAARLSDVVNRCYGNTLDGKSSQRYDNSIKRLLAHI